MNPERPRPGAIARAVEFLALDRNVGAVSASIFLISAGEYLWRRFLPRYLQALGASIRVVGLFGSLEDLLDGVYQYPGGWLGDRLGRSKALIAFVGLATAGYAVYRFSPSWPWVFVGIFLVSAWFSMASPALFAVVGDALPKERRAMGFTIQSILKRVPMAIAPVVGGVAIARMGLIPGMHRLFVANIILGCATIVVLRLISIPRIEGKPTNMRGVWRTLPSPLRWLLFSDVFIRTCDGLVDVFLVIWAIEIARISAPRYGVLIAIQMMTTVIVSIPAAEMARRIGRKPFVVATFIAFACFPLAVVVSRSFAALAGAFVIGGLREIGEPSRKALIVDFAEPALRARVVGLYYLIRSVAIAPAAFVGGLLWERRPALPFLAAFVIGVAGTLVFVATVPEEHAG